jgi:putative nucleotidyltransferase with HDIG domain
MNWKESADCARINAIRRHPRYVACYKRLEELEKDRIFCRHQMNHLLDVARIAYIRNLERGLDISREVIYATALLHDIGKGQQYEEGTPHEIASARIAEEILDSLPTNLQFCAEEKEQILAAIRGHRRLREGAEPLEALLYESDKLSRTCFSCPAEAECNWNENKKNKEILL